MKRLKNIIHNNKTIVGNIFSLGTLQIFNYIIPLITLPYILRVLGPEKYGTIAFIGALIGYCIILINYGFNYTATKDISIHRDDRVKISSIFWNVLAIKFFISLLAALIIFVLVLSFPIFSQEYLIIIFSFLLVFGEILFPVWLYQGMEQMKYITIITVLIRMIFLIPIFVFIRSADDYIWLPLISSLTSVTIGIIACIMAIRLFRISWVPPERASLIYHLREGWHVFISTVFISLYTTSTTFILGILTTPTIVGYYASAEKLVKAIQGLMGPISQAIYPSISQKLKDSREKTIVFLRKVTIVVSTTMLIISILLFISAEMLVRLLFGENFLESIIIIQILSFLPFVISIGNITLVLFMFNFGYQKMVTQIIIIASLIFCIISIPLTLSFSGVGMAIAVVITEIVISTLGYIQMRKILRESL